jgi:hypothetical protein
MLLLIVKLEVREDDLLEKFTSKNELVELECELIDLLLEEKVELLLDLEMMLILHYL